jgi:uncharacterized protein
MRTLHTAAALVVLLLVPCAAHAQVIDTIAEPRDAEKVALIQELIVVADFRQQVLRTMRETTSRQAASLPVPQSFWDRFLARAEKEVDVLIAPMVDDYTRYMTKSDLRNLIAFYKSPTGQRMIQIAPIIGANSSLAGSAWGTRVGAELAADLNRSSADPKATKKP